MKKINNVSITKIISMLLIFAFHCIIGIINDIEKSRHYFPLYVGVQIFIFLSGYLYSEKQINNYGLHIKKRFWAILVPYYIFMTLLLITYLIFDITKITLPIILQSIFCFHILYTNICSIGHLWYLFFALICYVFVPVLIWYRDHLRGIRKLSNNQVIAIKCFIFFIFLFDLLSVILLKSQITLSCFLIGFYYGLNKKEKANATKHNKVLKYFFAGVCFLIFSLIYYLFNCDFRTTLPKEIVNFLVCYSVLGLGVIITIFMLKTFRFANDKKLPSALKFLDENSYYFYITHHIFVISGNGLVIFSLVNTTPYVWLNIIIAFAISLASAYVLNLLTKLFNKIVNKKKTLKTKST